MNSFSRRTFLRNAVGGVAAASLPPFATALGGERSEPITATSLADNLGLFTGAGANVIAARGPQGALLVDGGREDRSADLIKAVLKSMSARRVDTLFNSHWHPERTGSNRRLGKSGTKIIAHENTRLWLSRKIVVSWRDHPYGPFPAQALPNETFYTSAQMQLGDEPIEYGYLPQAHTDGDIYVLFRKANVLAAGGLVTTDRWPLLDYETGGWMGGMVAGFNRLLSVADDKTRIVPADGPPLTRKELEAQRDMYKTIYERVVKSLTSGLGPDEAVAANPTRGFNESWGDPQPFALQAFKSLWGHFTPDA